MSDGKTISPIDENFRVTDKVKGHNNQDDASKGKSEKLFLNRNSDSDRLDRMSLKEPSYQNASRVRNLEKELSEVKLILSKTQEEVESYKTDSAKWQSQSKGTQTKLNKANGRIKELEAMLKVVNQGEEVSEDQKLMESYTKMENQIKEYKKQIKSLTTDLEQSQSKMERMVYENNKALETVEELDIIKETLSEKEKEKTEMKAHYEETITELQNELGKAKASVNTDEDRIQRMIDTSQRAKMLLETETAELKRINTSLTDTLSLKETELAELKLTLDSSTTKVEELEAKIKELEVTISEFESKSEEGIKLTDELSALIQTNTSLSEEINSLKADFEIKLKEQIELNEQKDKTIFKLKGDITLMQQAQTDKDSENLASKIQILESKVEGLGMQLQAKIDEANAYKLQATNFTDLVVVYNQILDAISKSNPDVIDLFGELLREKVQDKPDLVNAILAMP